MVGHGEAADECHRDCILAVALARHLMQEFGCEMQQHDVGPPFEDAADRLPGWRDAYLAGTGPAAFAALARILLLDQDRTGQVIDQQFVAKARHVDRARWVPETLQGQAPASAVGHRQQRAAWQAFDKALGGKKTVAHLHLPPHSAFKDPGNTF